MMCVFAVFAGQGGVPREMGGIWAQLGYMGTIRKPCVLSRHD